MRREFFVSHLTTALRDDELLVEIEVPALPAGARTGFAEHARTHGDWALAGAAAVVAPGHASIALLGAAPTPLRAAEAEAALRRGRRRGRGRADRGRARRRRVASGAD